MSSGTSLAVAAIAKDRKRIFLASNAASSAFNMDQCNAYTVQWRSDTYASANAIVSSTLKSGATKWYVIAADYNFGHALQNETTQIVQAAGGKMVGFGGGIPLKRHLLELEARITLETLWT